MYGVRAGFVLIRRYINHYHRDTVPQVISAWAPSSENDTTKYIDRVCQLSEIGPDEKLVYSNMEADASSRRCHDCGRVWPTYITAGYP